MYEDRVSQRSGVISFNYIKLCETRKKEIFFPIFTQFQVDFLVPCENIPTSFSLPTPEHSLPLANETTHMC